MNQLNTKFNSAIVRLCIFVMMVSVTFACIICGCLLCCMAFTMQDGFQEVRQFELLNFMKRFGSISVCLSIGGFFYVNKKIPLKMASTLHSAFSGLLILKKISKTRAVVLA
ncbi:uncharacterized protein LOC111614444 [Centruroides sculpturatus]|uniref:uncharacterized protein LOC111614439 n=1 Tax=Centruroides sculpturatus TaxID=218467 RepID=UPI000C6EFDCA|nr:uncharacterized protein LOC111614439 [Centruroides sculpturatus]XP_023211589.1 uncharacterized protein LOC111614444 [Centruroides sculpturatus]